MRILILTDDRLVPSASSKDLSTQTERDVLRALRCLNHDARIVGAGQSLGQLTERLTQEKPQLIFNLLEEFGGDAHADAKIVSLFELKGWKYTGCSAGGLLLARDKVLTKRLMRSLGILTPDFDCIARGKKVRISPSLRYPLFVKSSSEDASRGICQKSRVRNLRELQDRVEFLRRKWGTEILVEEFIPGADVYVAALGAQRATLLPKLELYFSKSMIRPENNFATERVKWSTRTQLRLAAKYRLESARANSQGLDKMLRRAIVDLRLYGPVRFDFRRDNLGRYFFLEANPNPDLCEQAEFALSAQHAGMSYENLIQRICDQGLRRRASR